MTAGIVAEAAGLFAVSNVDDVMDVLDLSCPRRGSQPPLWTSLTREIPLDIALFPNPSWPGRCRQPSRTGWEVAAEPAPEGVVALNQADTCALAAD